MPGGALNLISTNYPDHGHHGLFPIQGKTHMVEPGIEPGTSWLVVRSSDHQAMGLVRFMLEFCKLTNKLILYINVSLCMVIHDYMHIGYT